MNKNQLVLSKHIISMVKISKDVDSVGSEPELTNYLLRNVIAKYSLANDNYSTTQFTLNQMKEKGLDITKRGQKSRKNEYTFEHPIPAKVLFDLILKAKNDEEITSILKYSDQVVILSHSEDKKLNELGLKKTMPKDWKYGDDVFARYKKANISILTEKVKMTGGIKR